jgi:hypothetical protein
MVMPQMCLSVSADAALNRASVGESSDAAPIGFIVFSRQFLVLAFLTCRRRQRYPA